MAGKMTTFESELRQEGYSKEEEYFYELNRTLIEKRRQGLDRERALQREEGRKALHWLRCPKCGHEMGEQELLGIRFERCTCCKGVFFDDGELETILKTQEQKRFLHALWSRLRGTLLRPDTSWRP